MSPAFWIASENGSFIRRFLGIAGLTMTFVFASSPHPEAASRAAVERLTFQELSGWAQENHEQAFSTFLKNCSALAIQKSSLRPARNTGQKLAGICRKALASGIGTAEQARRFFEAEFEPWLIRGNSGDTGLLTGYYEPEFDGSLTRTEHYKNPLLARPDDLETIPDGETRPGIDPALKAARRIGKGFAPYPTREEIEQGALEKRTRPVIYLRSPAEAFIIHVQGSARIRLADGRTVRVAYAGRNGQPYTSIGRLLIERGEIDRDEMSLERLMGWLDAHPVQARDLMNLNKSFIFFRVADELSAEDGPIGGAGIPLVPGRSLAVDRRFWSYGLPFWLEGVLPVSEGVTEPLGRLMIAQDTGSAILGAARGDFFFGSGRNAGTRAGLMRHQTRFIVLQPKGWKPGSRKPRWP